jgi:GNAT superfamily N-acetyltransferase
MVCGDGPALREVRLRALEEAPGAFESALDAERGLPAAYWESFADVTGSVTFLAEHDGAVIGMAGGYLHPSNPRIASLVAMWVAPEARGTGAARALADTVAAWALEQGARSLDLCVVEDNAAALAFYRAAGFAPTGQERFMGRDPSVRELLMSRPLYS